MSDKIIDINRYLSRSAEKGGGAFSVWGGDGERARFALPLWRAIFLVGGDRGGIAYLPAGDTGSPGPFFVLDLGMDPARIDFPPPPTSILHSHEAPALARLPGGGEAVFLGEEKGKRWFLMVMGGEGKGPIDGSKRENLRFLAGECAGLLFFRDFAADAE